MENKYIIELEEAPFIQHFDNGIGETIYRVKGFDNLVFDWNGLQMLTPYTEDSAYAHGYTEAESKYREIRDELEKQAYQRGYKDGYNKHDTERIRKEAYDNGYETAKHECEDCGLNNYERGYKTAVGVYEGGYKKAIEDARLEGMNDAWECARKIASDNAGQNYSIFGQHFTVEILNTHSASEAIEKIRQYEQEQEEQIQVGDEVITASGKAVVTGVGPVHFEYVYADGSHGYDKVKNVKKTGRHFPEIAKVLEKMRDSK